MRGAAARSRFALAETERRFGKEGEEKAQSGRHSWVAFVSWWATCELFVLATWQSKYGRSGWHAKVKAVNGVTLS